MDLFKVHIASKNPLSSLLPAQKHSPSLPLSLSAFPCCPKVEKHQSYSCHCTGAGLNRGQGKQQHAFLKIIVLSL